MSDEVHASEFFIGWDVGGWNCDKNRKSRDALVILDVGQKVVGKPWRDNLRSAINEATDSTDWINRLFVLCEADAPSDSRITLAIDAPLGFSEAFVRLVARQGHADEVDRSDSNPYLFRQTEQFLFQRGLKPLSAVKDMIGSQATKGMHAIARFAPQVVRCGVWSDGQRLTVIEAYPSACKHSATVKALQKRFGMLAHDDLYDALTCALLAHLFDKRPAKLIPPGSDVRVSEGWIWVPRDGLNSQVDRNRK